MNRRHLLASAAAVLTAGCQARAAATYPVALTEAQWRAKLTPDQYLILREDFTEVAGTSPLLHEQRRGQFACVGCDQPVFSSDTKYDSMTGWPSFWAPLKDAVGEAEDRSLADVRTSIHCSRCGGHLGHVFPDGPKPTGKRYCMNGLVLAFKPALAG